MTKQSSTLFLRTAFTLYPSGFSKEVRIIGDREMEKFKEPAYPVVEPASPQSVRRPTVRKPTQDFYVTVLR